jgi:hypothetical protein
MRKLSDWSNIRIPNPTGGFNMSLAMIYQVARLMISSALPVLLPFIFVPSLPQFDINSASHLPGGCVGKWGDLVGWEEKVGRST